MRNLRLVFIFLIPIWILGCREVTKNGRVIFHVEQAMGRMAYLEQVPFSNESKKVLDSAKIKGSNVDLVFDIPEGEERVFRLKVSDSQVNIYFVNDVPEIEISVAILHPANYTISGSPANESLTGFLRAQDSLAEKGRKLAEQATGGQVGIDSGRSAKQGYDSIQRLFFERYRKFCDTVKSPASFLMVYNHVDFGKDYQSLKKFILRAAERFPEHSRIQLLKEKTLAYLKIFEEEYEVGQKLPDIVLPAPSGMIYSTAALHGKYYLLNFWSSWCDICFPYNEEIKKAKAILPASRFEAVSIAIDSEKEQWKTLIKNHNLNWVQLIDEKMWQGPAIQTYKIDSIPFNFLVNPEGIIIKKAISSDSILSCLRQYVK